MTASATGPRWRPVRSATPTYSIRGSSSTTWRPPRRSSDCLLGLSWIEGGGDVPMVLSDGPRTVKMAYAYSVAGPHHLELLQSVEDTVWTVAGGGHAHHIGYWSDDVEAATALLAAQGLPRVVNIGTFEEDAFPTGVYHQAHNGLYIEVLNRALKPVIFGPES